MRGLIPVLVLLAAWANGFSQETALSVPRVEADGNAGRAEGTFDIGLPRVSLYSDLSDRLKAAVLTSDLSAIQALYQTNGVSPEQLNEELRRWRPLLEGDAQHRVCILDHGCVFRDFSHSNKMWKKLANRLTSQKATHLVQLPTTAGYWNLPLVDVQDRFLILPSDQSKDMGFRPEDFEAGDLPVSANTNSTSGAAGPHR